jgi:hypothetical protein
MKKSTFIIGLVASFLFLIGVGVKIQHWPGGSIILFIGGALFAFGYAVMLLIDKNKLAQNSFQKFVNFMTMVSIMIVMLAFICKTQHWPGAGVGVFVGNFLLLAMIPVLIIHGFRESDPIKKLNFNNEALLLIVLTAFSYYMWLRSSVG